LRGGIIGLGVMGSHHLRVLRAMEDVDVVAVADADPQRLAMATRLHPGTAAYPTLSAMLAAERLDFACVAVPVGLLPQIAGEALAAGVHVLVEKPTAPTEKQVHTLIADADARGLTLGVGHVERFNPAVVAMKARIDAGTIGRVLHLHARRLSPFPQRQGHQGVALDLATHDIDVMRFVTGQEVARVFAESSAPLSNDEQHEDILCATVRLDDDTMGLLETNWMTPAKVRQLSVLGERGMLVVDYLTQDLMFYEHPTKATDWDALAGMRGGGEGDMIRYALERREPLRVEWEAFLGAVRRGEPAPVNGWDGLAALSTARAIRRSAARHETVVPSYRMTASTT
jgi:predicted dehydrogenase